MNANGFPSTETPNDGAWCNAILARFWWYVTQLRFDPAVPRHSVTSFTTINRNFQGSKGFNSFLSQGLCQRITKMTDFPGFIVRSSSCSTPR
jgi:hypothetical protein